MTEAHASALPARTRAIDLSVPEDSLIAGRYRLDAVLGVGGMGVVYAATDAKLDRPVALKAIHPEMASYGPARRRFRREAILLSTLETGHVPKLYAAHLTEPGGALIVTERLYGASLDQRLEQTGPIPIGEAPKAKEKLAKMHTTRALPARGCRAYTTSASSIVT